jgi:hypothetical protein
MPIGKILGKVFGTDVDAPEAIIRTTELFFNLKRRVD